MSSPNDLIEQAIALLRQAQAQMAPARITDRLPRPLPPLPVVGAAGTTLVDPTFGSTITRVTDATMGGASWRVPSNTHLAAFSADGRHLQVYGAGGQVLVLRWPLTTTKGDSPYSQVEPCFSRTLPDALFIVSGPKGRTIRAYDVETGLSSDIIDLDTLVPDLDANGRTYCGGVLAAGGALVSFFGGTGADRHHYVVWLKDGPPKVLDTQPLGYFLHSVAVDLSGRYVLLYPANAQPYQVIVWDTQTNTQTPVTVSPGGHDALGAGLWINADVASGPWDAAQWCLRLLTDLDHPHNLIDSVLTPKAIALADHTSWTGVGPVLSSTYRYAEPDRPWRAWDDEIIRIATDGSSVVERFAHHRSVYTAGDFWSQPIVNISPDGKRALFTSNWGQSLGKDAQGQVRQDVFCVEL